jgi:hypothetical protein
MILGAMVRHVVSSAHTNESSAHHSDADSHTALRLSATVVVPASNTTARSWY